MGASYEHGTLPDIMLLCAAFDAAEREGNLGSPERAWLVESLLTLCDTWIDFLSRHRGRDGLRMSSFL
jgi:hypothetical protein